MKKRQQGEEGDYLALISRITPSRECKAKLKSERSLEAGAEAKITEGAALLNFFS